MKALLVALLCSFLLLAAAQDVTNNEGIIRNRRWGFSTKSKVQNTHNEYTDSSINLNNANFGRSSNIVIGHGNTVRGHHNVGSGNVGYTHGQNYMDHDGDEKTYTYSESRVSNNGQNIHNVRTTYTDNSIHRNNANFEGATGVVIGHNKVLSRGPVPQIERNRNRRHASDNGNVYIVELNGSHQVILSSGRNKRSMNEEENVEFSQLIKQKRGGLWYPQSFRIDSDARNNIDSDLYNHSSPSLEQTSYRS